MGLFDNARSPTVLWLFSANGPFDNQAGGLGGARRKCQRWSAAAAAVSAISYGFGCSSTGYSSYHDCTVNEPFAFVPISMDSSGRCCFCLTEKPAIRSAKFAEPVPHELRLGRPTKQRTRVSASQSSYLSADHPRSRTSIRKRSRPVSAQKMSRAVV